MLHVLECWNAAMVVARAADVVALEEAARAASASPAAQQHSLLLPANKTALPPLNNTASPPFSLSPSSSSSAASSHTSPPANAARASAPLPVTVRVQQCGAVLLVVSLVERMRRFLLKLLHVSVLPSPTSAASFADGGELQARWQQAQRQVALVKPLIGGGRGATIGRARSRFTPLYIKRSETRTRLR